jgi:hypothetical protein
VGTAGLGAARARPETLICDRPDTLAEERRTAWGAQAALGEFQFGLTSGNLDYRDTERGGQPAAEFSWEGMDEMDPCSGRGWAVLEGGELHGMIVFHQGDGSGFVAKRAGGQKRPKRK